MKIITILVRLRYWFDSDFQPPGSQY